MGLKCLSINANGLNHPVKRHSLWEEVVHHKAVILAVQETNFHKHFTSIFSHQNYPHVFFSSTSTKKRGVLLVIKDSVSFVLKNVFSDPNGRLIFVTCELNCKPYTLASIYGPNTHQLLENV